MASLRRILRTFTASRDLGLPRIEGKVLVVGSAPGAVPPEGSLAGWVVMTINASQVIAETWGVAVPDFTIVRPHIGGQLSQDLKAREVLAGKRTGNLVLAGWLGTREQCEELFAGFDYGWQRLSLLTEWQKQRLLFTQARATSVLQVGKLNLSTGVLGAALCLALGARQVAMAGFSFTQHGHAYDPVVTPRLHIDGDRQVLQAMAARSGAMFAADAAFAAESGLPAWLPAG